MRNYIGCICFLLLSLNTVSASNNEQKQTVSKIEKFVLNQNFDSAQFYLSNNTFLEKENEYVNSLRAIAFNQSPSYADYLVFVEAFADKNYQKVNVLYKLIEEKIVSPKGGSLDFEYFSIKWILTTLLRNEAKMGLANEEYLNQLKYVEGFDQREKIVKKAQGYLLSHPIVLSQIEKDIEKGYQLCYQMQEIANEVKDTTLLIASYYHISDCYVLEKKLDEYIKAFNGINEQSRLQERRGLFVFRFNF